MALEIKAVAQLLDLHDSQMTSSMKSAKRKVGLLVNFNVPKLVDGVKRFVV